MKNIFLYPYKRRTFIFLRNEKYLGVPCDTKNMLRWLSNVISVFSWTVDIIDYTAFLIFGNLVFLYL